MLNGPRGRRTMGTAAPHCSSCWPTRCASIKVEPPKYPLRHWRGSGALFEYLNTSKRSVQGQARDLLTMADVFISNEPVDTGLLWNDNPSLVIVTITPFGGDGPGLVARAQSSSCRPRAIHRSAWPPRATAPVRRRPPGRMDDGHLSALGAIVAS